MFEAQSTPLETGTTVQFSDSDLMVRGVVVEVLPLGYVRVLWEDGFIPTTHRVHSLTRMGTAEA